MPFPTVKVLLAEKKSGLDAAMAAYLAAGGAPALDALRAIEMEADQNPADQDSIWAVLLAHGGSDVPASGAKTADLQYQTVEIDVEVGDTDDVAAMDAAVQAALDDAVHELAVVTDGITTTPGTVTSAGGTPFAAEDVGRKIQIGSEIRTISGFTSTSNVQYDDVAEGAFTSGTGLTIDMLGAEVLQFARISAHLTPQNKTRLHLMLAVEGEAN
jgi:hypothetical protein